MYLVSSVREPDRLDNTACPLTKSNLQAFDFVINRFFMKLFKTSNIDTVK